LFVEGEEGGQKRLAGKLRDEDICLSLMDKIQGEQGREEEGSTLGSFLSSASEPTITRQLNVLSNIVKRAFLFGGESELRVLAQTLEEEKSAFSDRWYGGEPNTKQVRTERGVKQTTPVAVLILSTDDDMFLPGSSVARRKESHTLMP
jgi:hypothetical protein